MGSGTNVQHRLIALHHLDAPWRPADVEQREGRILRQGNSNPEVQIYRYVTESSFDAYMRQTLETKAKFISQVMTGQSDLRRIEDVDGTALTYAEVKAIASGNPLVVEKAGIDAEVSRLTCLQTQHHETQYKLRQRIRHLSDDLPRLEKRLSNVREDIEHRQDSRGENFVIEIDGEIIRDRVVAGELINRQASRLAAGSEQRTIGSFAGFKLGVAYSFMGGATILLKGLGTYEAKVRESAHGTVRSIEYAAQNLDQVAFDLEQEIRDALKRIADLSAKCGQPFEYAERLSGLLTQQQEIMDALDLTKNQASGELESESPPAAPAESGASMLREIGFPEYDEY
jgi:TolA-binding protein